MASCEVVFDATRPVLPAGSLVQPQQRRLVAFVEIFGTLRFDFVPINRVAAPWMCVDVAFLREQLVGLLYGVARYVERQGVMTQRRKALSCTVDAFFDL